jgi:hypothetical protein
MFDHWLLQSCCAAESQQQPAAEELDCAGTEVTWLACIAQQDILPRACVSNVSVCTFKAWVLISLVAVLCALCVTGCCVCSPDQPALHQPSA